jgi:hypothetical protein
MREAGRRVLAPAEGDPGPQDLHVVVDLLVGDLIELALPARRLSRAGVEGSREVAVVAVAADHVGIERDQLVLAQRIGLHLLAHAPEPVGADRRQVDRLLRLELIEHRQLGQI